MKYFYIPTENRITELDDALYQMWTHTGNPKANYYRPIPDPPGPGYTWDGTQWVAPLPYVPQQVTRFQGKAALLNAGLLANVEAAVAAGTDPLLALAWTDALTFDRQSPMVASITQALGLTESEVDNLFIAASQIQV